MASRRTLRVPVIALLLVLVALPALAGVRSVEQPERGFLEALVRAFAKLVPTAAGLVDELLREGGGSAPEEDSHEPAPEGDLGPGLDPLG